MTEEFLHFIWRFKNFTAANLVTTKGEKVHIIKPGEHNHNAGPDFLNAQVKIGQTEWAGHVEVHIKSSDWIAHKHSKDNAYKNVVLHVVYDDDKAIDTTYEIPVLRLSPYISPLALENYKALQNPQRKIPCEQFLPGVSEFTKTAWLERMLIERLETKSKDFEKILKETGNDWNESAYRLFVKNFGFKVNGAAFEALAKSLPYKLISRHRNNLHQIEALLFGQAGFLEETLEGEYPNSLKKEYSFLSKKYKLSPLAKSIWKFHRMHPANFPTLRIAELSAILYKQEHLSSKFLELKGIEDAKSLLSAEASEYWKSHYTLTSTETAKPAYRLGQKSIDNIVVNTIAVLQFSYGLLKNLDRYKEMAVSLLSSIPPENNHITRTWESAGLMNTASSQSQALLHLKKDYCDKFRCLDCGIGTSILRNTNPPVPAV